MKTHLIGIRGLFVILATQACAGAQIENPGGGGGSGPGGGGGPQGGNGGSTVSINLDVAPPQPDTRSNEPMPDLTGYNCDDAGNCTLCQPVRIMSLGQPAKYGANSGSADSTASFEGFMNGNTKGTASMTMQMKFTALTDQLLNQYDVLILQALEDSEYTGLWTFAQSDADALYKWVNERGGAVIAMTGYGGNTSEVQPLNQLLAPFGISYNPDDIFSNCPDNLCYCSYSSIPFNAWINTPDCSAITVNHDGSELGKVGLFHGRSINCTGSGCSVIAKDPTAGGNLGVGKSVGKGRVFAWADEWVTYTSQWGLAPDTSPSAYDDPNKSPQCVGHTPYQSYVVPQFWYNVFRWVAQTSCLTIVVPPTAGSVPQIIY